MAASHAPGALRRLVDSDLAYSFWRSRTAPVAALVALATILAAILAPWIAPHDPYDAASIDLLNSQLPPVWHKEGSREFLLGTDHQGRDILSTVLHGARTSLLVGVSAVALALASGVALGLIAGWHGGWIGAFIMRVADIQLAFPAILVALLIEGVARGFLPKAMHEQIALPIVVLAIGFSGWVQYARTVRGSVLVERNREYVQAAWIMGVSTPAIMIRHVLPNVVGPVFVIATIHLAIAMLSEATLSFLGVGVPPTRPSLGTMIRIGNDFLFSGQWWITLFPSLMLAIQVLAINLLGDWLRDALNPKLRGR